MTFGGWVGECRLSLPLTPNPPGTGARPAVQKSSSSPPPAQGGCGGEWVREVWVWWGGWWVGGFLNAYVAYLLRGEARYSAQFPAAGFFFGGGGKGTQAHVWCLRP